MRIKVWLLSLGLGLTMTMSGCSLSSGNQNYNKAVSAYEKGEYAKAEEYFMKAISHNSDKAEYHIDYGFNLIASKEYDKAIEQFQYVILDKDIPMVKANNKKAHRGIGIANLMKGHYESAMEQFDLALACGQDERIDNDIRYYKASALLQMSDVENAVALYTEILEKNAQDYAIYNARAGLYRMMKEYDLSIADYDKAIELSPKDFNLYVGKFATLKEYGKNAEAAAVLEQATQLKVTTDSDKFELAKVHFYQGEYVSAKNELAAVDKKVFPEAYYFIAEISLSEGDYKSAIENYNNYVDAGSSVSAMLYNQLATCYLMEHNYEKAEECLSKADNFINLNVHDQLLKNNIICMENTGRFEEALNLMEEYMKQHPEDEQAQKDYYFLTTRVEAASIPVSQEPVVVKP